MVNLVILCLIEIFPFLSQVSFIDYFVIDLYSAWDSKFLYLYLNS